LALSLIAAGCGGNADRTRAGEDGKTVVVSVSRKMLSGAEAYGLDRVASELAYIPLETGEHCLLKEIRDVFPIGDCLLVSDFNNLYMFDRQGKYIRKISQQGQGPDDYVRVSTVIVDDASGEFYLVTNGKMLKYTRDGVYRGNIPKEQYSVKALMTPAHTLLFYIPARTVYAHGTDVYSLLETDTAGRVLRRYPNHNAFHSDNARSPLTIGARPLYMFENTVCFNEWGNDTIFALAGDTVTPKLVIEMGDMKLDPYPDLSYYTSAEAMNFLMSESRLCIENVWEDRAFYYIILYRGYGGDHGVEHCVYDKRAGTFHCAGTVGLTNNLDGGLPFFPLKVEPDGTKFMWKDAVDFKDEILSGDYETRKNTYGERFENVYRLALALREDDNPVLIIAR
ncbi:MAG: 6-bladed beta-propeller, partial [Tannerella sp.]|nr:6-bladed beta-propeller [Tannerella sp.]